jgi:hypothetical protein
MEVDDEARPSTQLYGRNQRKNFSKLKNTKSGENTLKITEKEKWAAHLEMRFNHKDKLY